MSAKKLKERLIKIGLFCCASFSVVFVFSIIAYMLYLGYPWLTIEFSHGFEYTYYMWTTMYVATGGTALAVIVALPCAIYMAEFSSMRFRNFTKTSLELLDGLPSIVLGLTGLALLVNPVTKYSFTIFLVQNFGLTDTRCIFFGWVILAIMSFPIIATITEDALRSVPQDLREASLGVGATKWQTTTRVLLPSTKNRVLASILLALAAAMGETVAIWYVLGNTLIIAFIKSPFNPFLPTTSLTMEINQQFYAMNEAGGTAIQPHLFAAAFVLFIMIGAVNISVRIITANQGGGSLRDRIMNINQNFFKEIYRFFKSKEKENLVSGTLVFISAIIASLPGIIYMDKGLAILPLSIYNINEWISVIVFSLVLIVPCVLLFSISYLLWEGHSLGWKLSTATCAIALFLTARYPTSAYITIPIAALSGLSAYLEFRIRKTSKNKDSPVIFENVIKLGLRFSAIIPIAVISSIVIFVVTMGSPYLSLDFITKLNLNIVNIRRIAYLLPPIGSTGGILSFALGSILLIAFCEFIAVPIGIGAAIYLAEYAPQGKINSILRFFIETLAGAPSVIIGLIGFSIFFISLHWEWSLYSGAISLSFLALPWNIRVAEEAIKSVPTSYREASFALGATQWQTVRNAVLYAAMPGIITGILLGIGVVIGETLVVNMTVAGLPNQGFPSPWWRIFNIHQQLPVLTAFIYQVP